MRQRTAASRGRAAAVRARKLALAKAAKARKPAPRKPATKARKSAPKKVAGAAALLRARQAAARGKALRAKEIARAKAVKIAAAREKARLAAEAKRARAAAAKEKARLAAEAKRAKAAAAGEKARLAAEAKLAKVAGGSVARPTPSTRLVDEDLDDDLDDEEEDEQESAAEEPSPAAEVAAPDKEGDGKGGKVDPRKPGGQRMTDSAFRLSPDFRPREYRVHVLPDLVQGKFRGEIIIDLDLKRATPSIELHCADIAIDHAEVAYPDVPDTNATRPWMSGRQPSAGAGPVSMRQSAVAIVPHAPRETVEIKFLRPLAAGHVRLAIGYHGPLQEKLRGLYKATSGGRRYAFTQLEAADARRFFPCFDEPEYKAKFTFSVTTETNLTVISNGAVERVDRNAYGTATRHFKTTPKMSTYLCALAVGELESSPVKHVGKTAVRVWSAPGKTGLTAFSLDAAVECLKRLEAWFDLPYPYEKLDLVAVPDFEAGAMENVGAVFFRETLLLVDPETITVAEKKRVAEVIAHELAHMWFGNLVTMKWWDDLWLNEAFAEWFAHKGVHAIEPSYLVWSDFQADKNRALVDDALPTTHPIYTDVATPAQALEMFDVITYQKGCAVMRMLENFLGEAPFRDGIQSYMKAFQGQNAAGPDLWMHLSAASGQPVEALMKSWVEQPGFPVVSLELAEHGGRPALALSQRRFFSSPAAAALPSEQRWNVPMVVRFEDDEGVKEHRFIFGERERTEPLPATGAVRWVYGNAEEIGFYRVALTGASVQALLAALPKLAPVEQMGLLEDQWALVRNGASDLARFLPVLEALATSDDHHVLRTVAERLYVLDELLDDARAEAPLGKLRARIAALFGPHLAALGWEPRSGESQNDVQRRAVA
ncbi:M1 family metallopeptidase, partial [bacterium]|nr:M1 family metallopeptidase [bacterium]